MRLTTMDWAARSSRTYGDHRTGCTAEDVVPALVEVPRAVIHRYLTAGRTPPPKAADLLARSARKLLRP